jgi:hypothetical protein
MSAPLRGISLGLQAAQQAAPQTAADTVSTAASQIEAQARSVDGGSETVVIQANGPTASLTGVDAQGRTQSNQPAAALAQVDIAQVADSMASEIAGRAAAAIVAP